MLLLDTNVLSELMRPATSPSVAAYLRAQDPETLFTSALCEAEIRYGLARLPEGRRRESLELAFRTFVAEGFGGRVIAFDSACAEAYGALRARREAAGLPVSIPDAMIAATALAYGASVVTRNVSDFDQCGVAVIDPWKADPVTGRIR